MCHIYYLQERAFHHNLMHHSRAVNDASAPFAGTVISAETSMSRFRPVLELFWVLVGVVALLVQPAAAQKWPEKPVRIVTPFAPGGGTDVFARLLAQRFAEVYGQQFIVDNRPGAGSTTGTEFVARSPADGYTLLMTSASFTFNPGLYPKLRYDSLKDFAPVSQVVRVPHVILVLPSLPAKNLQDLVRLAKSKPGDEIGRAHV